jgi:hypothetical protein
MKKYQSILFLFLSGLLLFSQNVNAQQNIGEMNTDRPDITESAVVVPQGYAQFEDGFLIETQKSNIDDYNFTIHNYTYSSLLARIGIYKNIELRLGGDYLNMSEKTNGTTTNNYGFNNLLIGGKYQLSSEEYSGQDVGFLLQFYLPLGIKTVRPKNIEPEIIFAYGRELAGPLSVGINIGSHWDSYKQVPSYLYSVSFGISIIDDIDSFLEYYGDASSGSSAGNNFDFGFAFRPVDNFQIDVSAGNESFSNLKNWFAGAGISLRIPH